MVLFLALSLRQPTLFTLAFVPPTYMGAENSNLADASRCKSELGPACSILASIGLLFVESKRLANSPILVKLMGAVSKCPLPEEHLFAQLG